MPRRLAKRPALTRLERAELRRMLAELEEWQYTPRHAAWDTVGRGHAADWTAGHGNAPVYGDLMRQRRSTIPAADVRRHIRDLIDGTGRTSVWMRRALDVARARMRGEGWVSAPILPPEAGLDSAQRDAAARARLYRAIDHAAALEAAVLAMYQEQGVPYAAECAA